MVLKSKYVPMSLFVCRPTCSRKAEVKMVSKSDIIKSSYVPNMSTFCLEKVFRVKQYDTFISVLWHSQQKRVKPLIAERLLYWPPADTQPFLPLALCLAGALAAAALTQSTIGRMRWVGFDPSPPCTQEISRARSFGQEANYSLEQITTTLE